MADAFLWYIALYVSPAKLEKDVQVATEGISVSIWGQVLSIFKQELQDAGGC